MWHVHESYLTYNEKYSRYTYVSDLQHKAKKDFRIFKWIDVYSERIVGGGEGGNKEHASC